jgi:parallel beta-helix repeat protein
MVNSTLSGNTAVNGNGGGLALHISGAATIQNCTVVDNAGRSNGGGIWRDPASTDPTQVRNSIIARNYVAGAGPDVSGDFASLGSNLIGDITGSTGFLLIGDLFGTEADPLDPKLASLANSGGPTKTHALLAGSPALDEGNTAGLPLTDQRGGGFPRQKDGNGDGIATVDIGAFEK